MSDQGFDPSRISDVKRAGPVIPQILSAETPHLAKGFTEIKVVGLGGAGNNTVDRMIEEGVQGIDFIAVNTDTQALDQTLARKRLHIGERLTRGVGTGGDARVGAKGAEAAADAIEEVLTGADMVFVTAGLGGGTGTGAAPVVAGIAQRLGALTIGIVTMPFGFEGARRRAVAVEGLNQLRPSLDAAIVIANDRLLHETTANVAIRDSFRAADVTLHHGIQGIADLVLTPGLINLDFADVRSVMERSGTALMAMGQASGEDRAVRAVTQALSSPLLDTSIEGARGILLNISGSSNLTLHEVNEAASLVSATMSRDCNMIFGAVINPRLRDDVRVTIIAAGLARSASA